MIALSRDFQHNAYQVTVGSLDLRANIMIKQIVEVVSDYDKYGRLCDHLKNFNDGSRVLIFVETKKGCDQLTRSLQVSHIDIDPTVPSVFPVPFLLLLPLFAMSLLPSVFIFKLDQP